MIFACANLFVEVFAAAAAKRTDDDALLEKTDIVLRCVCLMEKCLNVRARV